jgi:hypothetical protein
VASVLIDTEAKAAQIRRLGARYQELGAPWQS